MFTQLIHFYLLASLAVSADDCRKWFIDEKLKPGPSCFDHCELRGLGTDLLDITCAARCRELCNSQKQTPPPQNNDSKKPYILYPGLTEAEKSLIAKNPREVFKVFIQKNIAEESAYRNFPEGLSNDESDAFRHFIWSGLLIKELGIERAKVYLDAHEQNAQQTAAEKAMDVANNQTSLAVAQKMLKENRLTLENLENEALNYLRNKNLVVLKPQGNIPKEPMK